MNLDIRDTLTSIAIVTLVFGIFVLFAILRIKNSYKGIFMVGKSKVYRTLKKLDLIFSGILLIAMIIFYSFFILNLGK